MKHTVKRRDIIAALRFNNLVAGSWIESDFQALPRNARAKTQKPNCTGCLVGNTLNRSLPKHYSYSKVDDICCAAVEGAYDISDKDNALEEVANGNYLAALSCMFEGTIDEKFDKKYPDGSKIPEDAWRNIKLGKRDTNKLIAWVKKHIPVTFEIEI